MRNIKLVLEYDGAAFFGFQKQPHHPTVQEALEKALSRLLGGKAKIKAASGRTDTGVHALRQVVNFNTQNKRPVLEIQKALNALLPRAVAVTEVREMPSDFHARYSARFKNYEYQIWNAPVRSPLFAGRSHHVPEKLNLARMKKGAKMLEGRHDFLSFCAADPARPRDGKQKNTVRTLRRVALSKKGNLIRLGVEGDGFLYRMVRNLAGALIELGRGRIQLSELQKILQSKDRRRAPATAPACGLCLMDVTY